MSETQTLFKRVDYHLDSLLNYVEIGDIGLPDIQRPFVWTPAKVRDLLDSMYRGFPVGYLLFWSNSEVNGGRPIGTDTKAHRVPSLLVVDGQQRLTSLYAVFRGQTVLDEDYRETRIEIAFRPRDGKFEVAGAAIRKDPEYIPNVSDFLASKKGQFTLVSDFFRSLEAKRPLSNEERQIIEHNMSRLFGLLKYPFTALEITSGVDEEQVGDIFVRINSEGVKLNQADFILTLLSVFWEEGRVELEKFSRDSRSVPGPHSGPSPFNHFIHPGPDQLLRVEVAVGFLRGRLKSVYQVLRGKDLETGTFSPERREQQFTRLHEAQEKVLNLNHWHQFLNSLVGAGFRSGELISSENALLFAYAFYLIGKTKYGVPQHKLQKLMGRWFYASSLSGRYTGSPESVMDGDLNRLKDLEGPDEFIATLEKIIDDTFTSDFWTITLPNELETSSPQSPGLFAFYAAQNKLDAPVLFSNKKIAELLDPSIRSKKKALERHHLFPRAWLESQGVDDLKLINQIANFALLEWPDNIDISNKQPTVYVPIMRDRFTRVVWERMCELHALPPDWESMPYLEFLRRRRVLMAQIIRRGFEACS